MRNRLFVGAFLATAGLLWMSAVQAGLFSQVRTEASRLDVPPGTDAPSVLVEGLALYSMLREGADGGRILKGIGSFHDLIERRFKGRDVRVSFTDLADFGSGEATVAGSGAAWTQEMTQSGQSNVMTLARSYRESETSLPASYRLILMPERVAYSSGLEWWHRSGTSPGVPHYVFTVFWMLEDVNDKPVAQGKTTSMVDIRGFPAKGMAEQIVSELEKLDVRFGH